MKKNGKITVHVRVDPKVWDDFKQLVTGKYQPDVFGGISIEVESMLKNWLSAHTNITNKPAKLNPLGSRSERYAKDIINWIRGKTATFQVHRNLIVKAIEETRGSDSRTFEKWFNYLAKHSHIKPLGGDMWEIL